MKLTQLFENDNPFYYVFVKYHKAQVVPEIDTDTIMTLQNNGYKLVWDSARTESEGYTYASRYHEAVREDYTDKHNPKPIANPVRLFRSVSIPELFDILETGSIAGDQNKFNAFDTRRWVFFTDHFTPLLIAQGEELERQVSRKLNSSELHKSYEAIAKELEKLHHTGDFRNPFTADSKRRFELRDQLAEVEKEYREQFDFEQSVYKSWLEKLPYTSAILETKPLRGGFHYSKNHGLSGMGDEDEFGFPPNAVKWSDITKVYLIKNKKIAKVLSNPNDLYNLQDQFW